MTTATHTETPEAVQAALVRELATLKDPLDAPTDREKRTLTARRHALQQHITVGPGLIERLSKPMQRRAVVHAALDRLREAEATLDTLIADAPDYREIADQRASTAEWARQNALAASKTALYRGVEYLDSRPVLPGPLADLLTPPPCATCQRPHEPFWPGPLSALEAEMATLDKAIAEAQFWLDAHLGSARALLAETVETA